MAKLCLCITGTDTDAGKTVVTAGLARAAQAHGRRVLVIKPVQTGCRESEGGLLAPELVISQDGLLAPDVILYREACPGAETGALVTLRDACSPHLAARREGVALKAEAIASGIAAMAASSDADVVLVEGAGGLLTPLNERETLADVLAALGWPVLLVAGNKLGAVNHALLTLEALRGRGLTMPGFVLSEPEPVADADPLHAAIRADNGAIIAASGNTACLADIGHIPALNAASPERRRAGWDDLAACLSGVLSRLEAEASASGEDASALADFDREHIWHPYTSALKPLYAREAVSTRGARIRLRDGRELVDGMASWWCAIHGYNHPVLLRALREQAARMPHVMFGGLTHEPAVTLARSLLSMAPKGMDRVFFADSGSVAVEVALKMALQYQQARGHTARTRLLTVRGGYHGDTLGAMSVCDPHTGMHSLFTGMLAQQLFAPRPDCRFDAPYDPASTQAFEVLLAAHAHETAAVILEPIVQGAGGMWMYHPEYLRRVHALCREHGCLLILDEIATGFGRTGKLFACEHAGISPDILCLGKGLTGGVMTLSATLASREVARGVSRDGGVLMHGPTFMANPLACAVASGSLDLLAGGGWRDDVARLERLLRDGLEPCRALPGVADVRVLGAVGVLEMAEPVDVERVQAYFVEKRGVWIRPFGRLIYVMPPYVASDGEIATLTAAMRGAVEEGRWNFCA